MHRQLSLSNAFSEDMEEERKRKKKRRLEDKANGKVRHINRLTSKAEELRVEVAELDLKRKQIENETVRLRVEKAREEGYVEGKKAAKISDRQTTPKSSSSSCPFSHTSTPIISIAAPICPPCYPISSAMWATPPPQLPTARLSQASATYIPSPLFPTPPPSIPVRTTYFTVPTTVAQPPPLGRYNWTASSQTPPQPQTRHEYGPRPSYVTVPTVAQPPQFGRYNLTASSQEPLPSQTNDEYVPHGKPIKSETREHEVYHVCHRSPTYWTDLGEWVWRKRELGRRLYRNPIDDLVFQFHIYESGVVRVRLRDGVFVIRKPNH